MSNYLLIITPRPLANAEYASAFCNLIGCNEAYAGTTWDGVVTFAKTRVGALWASLVQMNDQAVEDHGTLTIVWSVDPYNSQADGERAIYLKHRRAIIAIVDDWAASVGSVRGNGMYFEGDVCWVIEHADTAGLTADFAKAQRSRFSVVK